MEQLSARGLNVASLSGDLDQSLRERTITRLKRGKIDVLIATDVAARGLDVPRITHVINYDLPQDAEAYTHRIGRTGRAGRDGIAITFAGNREGRKVGWLERATGRKMEDMELPDEAAIRAHRDAVFQQRVVGSLTKDADTQRELVERLIEEGHDPVELACAFAALARADEAPIGRLQAPRKERAPREGREGKAPRRERGPTEGMTRYRVAVGHKDGIKPGQLVGALANEGGIEGNRIGRIDIRNAFSVVELPSGLPSSILPRWHGPGLAVVRWRSARIARRVANAMTGRLVANEPDHRAAQGRPMRSIQQAGESPGLPAFRPPCNETTNNAEEPAMWKRLPFRLRGYLITMTGVLLLSPDALLIKDTQAEVATFMFWRGLLLGSVLLVIAALRYRARLPDAIRACGAAAWWCPLAFAGSAWAFVCAARLTAAGNVLVMMNLAPLVAGLIGMIVFGQRLRRQTWVVIAVCVTGACLMAAGEIGQGSRWDWR